MTQLLPPNATPLERTIADVIDQRLGTIDFDLRSLWDPHSCPAPLLGWLAWAESVDIWDEAWDEARKRAVIAAAPEVHRRKGTIGAMRRALDALGIGLVISEWFETGDAPGTHRIDAFADTIFAAGFGLNAELFSLIAAQIDSVKRESQHFTLRVGERFASPTYVRSAARIKVRHSMTIEPRPEADIETSMVGVRAAVRQRSFHRVSHSFEASTH